MYALEKNEPFPLPTKKTKVLHWFIPDTQSTDVLLSFVRDRVKAGAKYVWGPLDKQDAIQHRMHYAFKKLFTATEFEVLKPSRTHTFRHTRIAQLKHSGLQPDWRDMHSGHAGSTRENYHGMTKQSARDDLVAQLELHVNHGKAGYFPTKFLQIT